MTAFQVHRIHDRPQWLGTFRRGSTWLAWIETRSKAETHKHGEADTPSHALALALLAALEAEQ